MRCQKDQITFSSVDNLPPFTQEGKNTLGLLINGEIWIPRGSIFRTTLRADYDGNYFGFSANRTISNDEQSSILVGLKNVNRLGIYNYGNDFSTLIYSSTLENYFEATVVSGYVEITKLDLTNRIISGKFEFKLRKTGSKDLNATEGRFDFKIW